MCFLTFQHSVFHMKALKETSKLRNFVRVKSVDMFAKSLSAVRRGDVLSAWSGIRPLVSDPNKGDTQSLARNHIVHVSNSNLVTIAGGKWTTYRSMAAETIDAAITGISTVYSFISRETHSHQVPSISVYTHSLPKLQSVLQTVLSSDNRSHHFTLRSPWTIFS